MSYTKQETFDLSYRGLARQGFIQSMNADRSLCAYRGQSGTKCAAGHLIPDDKYDPNFEGGAVMRGVKDHLLKPGTVHVTHVIESLGHDVQFVGWLQSIHDGCEKPSEMRHDLEILAREEGLTVPQMEMV